jgi:hypothetical protein
LLSGNVKVKLYKSTILPLVSFGCETWSVTPKEEQRLRVSEKRFQRRIFGHTRNDVTGEWRKLHNEELHSLYSSPNIIRQIKLRQMRWAGHVARVGKDRKVYKVLVVKPKERDHSENQGVDGWMGSEWILRRLAGGCGLDSTG